MQITRNNFTDLDNLCLSDSLGLQFSGRTSDPADADLADGRLYYNSSSQALKFYAGSSWVTLGAAGGGGGVPSWDAIYSGDKTMTIGAGTLTFAGNSADASDVLTLTNVAGSTGSAIQITNATTSNPDIKGTAGVWKVLGTGAATFLSVTLSGTAGSTVQTITAGDVVYSDGSLAITDADNAATFTVTNNTATSASVFVLAGSGVFTGSTTTSFLTLTPSGLTTGTAFYLPVAALTTGKAIHVVANAATDGLVVNVTSSATALTATGRLLSVSHSGATTTSGVIAEFSTAGNDETTLMKLTASSLLAAGAVLNISASSMTTGKAITIANLDALTDGKGVNIVSAATAMTSTGRLLMVDHTGATSTSGVLSEFKTAATDETVLLQLSTAAMVNGVALSIVGTTGMTSGSLLRLTSSTAGALATNGVVSLSATGNFTSTSAIDGGFVEVKANSTTAGTVVNVVSSALTTGVGLILSNGTSAMTTGSLVRVNASGTGAIATNGIVSFTHAGIFTSTSATNGGFVEIKANATVAGTVLNVVSSALTTGVGLQLSNGTSAITTGSLVRVTASGTGVIATNGIVSITHAGIFTSTSNAGVLDVQASALVGAGTVVNFKSTAAAQTASTVLNVENSGFTTGYTGSMAIFKSPTTTGACKVVSVIADGMSTGGVALNISTAALSTAGIALQVDLTAATAGNALKLVTTGAYTGTGMGFISMGAMTTGVGLQVTSTTGLTTGSLIRATSSTAGAIATNGAISFSATGAFTSTAGMGFVSVQANATQAGTAMSISATALTSGTVLALGATEATLTTGLYLQCFDGAASDFSIGKYGATVIAGNASGTASLTQTAGNHLLTSGNVVLTDGTIITTPQAIVNANTAISVTHGLTTIANNAGSTHTLADGVVGQRKTIVCTVYTGDAVITPSNLANGTTITLNAVGDACELVFAGTEWWVVNLYGTAALA